MTGDCASASPGTAHEATPAFNVAVFPASHTSAGSFPGPFVGAGSLRANVTVPVGVSPPDVDGATVAENVTGWPTTAEAEEEEEIVVVEMSWPPVLPPPPVVGVVADPLNVDPASWGLMAAPEFGSV